MATDQITALKGMSQVMGDYVSAVTTATGTTTTAVAAARDLGGVADNWWIGSWIYFETGTHAGTYRRITDSAISTGTTTLTFDPPLASASGNAVTISLHRFRPGNKIDALNRARLTLAVDIQNQLVDDTTWAYPGQVEFPYPANLVSVPKELRVEDVTHLPADQLLANPQFDSWTSTSVAADWTVGGSGTLAQEGDDSSVPYRRTGPYSARLVGGNSIDATLTADAVTAEPGKPATFWAYVFHSGSDDRVMLALSDGTTTATSDAHPGTGWALLQVTLDPVGSAATTLTAAIVIVGGTGDLVLYADSCGVWMHPAAPAPKWLKLDVWEPIPELEVVRVPTGFGREWRRVRIMGDGNFSALSASTSIEIDNPQHLLALYWLGIVELYLAEQGQNVGVNGYRDFQPEIELYMGKYTAYSKTQWFRSRRTARPLRSDP